MRASWRICLLASLPALVTAPADAQDLAALAVPGVAAQTMSSAPADPPITPGQRIDWIVGGVIGPRSLGVGVLAGAMQTAIDVPEEWHRSWSGFSKRYLEREADVAISNALEGGLGAIWGEDPRYLPSKRRGIWPRARYAMKTVVLAPRRDGRLAPAWGRFAGNIFNNVIENAWLPPSATTPAQTTLRSASGLLGRLAGNLWEEFWPDVRLRIGRRHLPRPTTAAPSPSPAGATPAPTPP